MSRYCSSLQMSGPISAQMQDSRDMPNTPICWRGKIIFFNPGFLRMCSHFSFFLKLVGFCFQYAHRCLSLVYSSLLAHHSLDATYPTFPLNLPLLIYLGACSDSPSLRDEPESSPQNFNPLSLSHWGR